VASDGYVDTAIWDEMAGAFDEAARMVEHGSYQYPPQIAMDAALLLSSTMPLPPQGVPPQGGILYILSHAWHPGMPQLNAWLLRALATRLYGESVLAKDCGPLLAEDMASTQVILLLDESVL